MARKQKKDQGQESVVVPAGLLNVEGAAKWLGVSRSKLFELMHEKDFPVIVITTKMIRFDPQSLYQWALKRQKSGRWIA